MRPKYVFGTALPGELIHMRHFLISSAFSLLIATVATGSENKQNVEYKSRIDLGFATGLSKYSGNLNTESTGVSTYSLAVRGWLAVPSSATFDKYVEVSWLENKPQTGVTTFPFTSNQKLIVDQFAMTLHACFFSEEVVQPCYGIGYGVVQIRDSESQIPYGSAIFKLSLRHAFGEAIFADVAVNYFDLHQRLAGVNADLRSGSLLLGLGYRFTTVANL